MIIFNKKEKKEKTSQEILEEIKRKKGLFTQIDKKLSGISKREKIYLLTAPFLLFGFLSYYYVYPYTNNLHKEAEKYFKSIQDDIYSSKNMVNQYQVLINQNKIKNKKLVDEINKRKKDLLVLTDIANLMNFLNVNQIYLENNLYESFMLMNNLGIKLNSLVINDIKIPLKKNLIKNNQDTISFNLNKMKSKINNIYSNNNIPKKAYESPAYKNYKLKYNLDFVVRGNYKDILKYVYFWENKKELVLTKKISYNPKTDFWNINIQIYSLKDKGIK